MTVIVCVDDNMGMMFNGRRQSRDSRATARIFKMSGGRLLMNEYSSALFKKYNVSGDPDFLKKAGDGDFCFVENDDLSGYKDKIKKLIMFRWNRVYPFDRKLDVLPDDMVLEKTFDFVGTSHEKITCEVWTR